MALAHPKLKTKSGSPQEIDRFSWVQASEGSYNSRVSPPLQSTLRWCVERRLPCSQATQESIWKSNDWKSRTMHNKRKVRNLFEFLNFRPNHWSFFCLSQAKFRTFGNLIPKFAGPNEESLICFCFLFETKSLANFYGQTRYTECSSYELGAQSSLQFCYLLAGR